MSWSPCHLLPRNWNLAVESFNMLWRKTSQKCNFHFSILITVDQVGAAVMFQTVFGRCEVRISDGVPDLLTVSGGFPQSLQVNTMIYLG
jgi:hypothetical protein